MTAIKQIKLKNSSQQPIFILCHARSGSTLLRFILDTHDQIYCPPELHIAQNIVSPYLLHFKSFYRPNYLSADDPALEQRVCAQVRRIVNTIMAPGLTGTKRIWCDKSVTTLNHLVDIKKMYPEGRYICLYRHCMDFAHSALQIMKYGIDPVWDWPGGYAECLKNSDNFVNSLAGYWCQETEKIHNFQKENPKQCFVVNYEALVFQPERTCESIFSFLGLRYDKTFLGRVFQSGHQQGPGDFKILWTRKIETNSVGEGKTISRKQLKPSTLPRMNALLTSFGYEPVDESWNTKAPPHRPYGADDKITQEYARKKLAEIFKLSVPLHLRQRSWHENMRGKCCKVVIKDVPQAAYLINYENLTCRICENSQSADCVITLGFETLVKLQNRLVNITSALYEGLVVCQGDWVIGEMTAKLLYS
jgi:hypothetical protein